MISDTDRFETDRLIIRRFAADDWAGILDIAIDKEASPEGKYDHAWPTTEEGCRGAAGYFANNGCYWAVCVKPEGRVVGLLSFNNIEENGCLELGHLFHREFANDDLDTEALGCVIDHAFRDLDMPCIVCRNAAEWEAQLAPLRALGLQLKGVGKEPASFQNDEDGNPIEFLCCEMTITRDEWLAR